MKFAVSFALLSLLLLLAAASCGGWLWLLAWPSFSFAIVAAAYMGAGPCVFGKRPDGTLRLVNLIALLPYLLYTGLVWRIARFLSREAPFNQLSPSIYLGRRLLSDERDPSFQNVIDLTGEFIEPYAMRAAGYRSFPILDASVPDHRSLVRLVEEIEKLEGVTYIHCAQGHGRTVTVAAAYLLLTGQVSCVDQALDCVLACRPGAKVGKCQKQFLNTLKQKG